MNTITIGEIAIDLDSPCKESHSTKELLHRVIGLLHHQQKQLKEIRTQMVDQATLDASLKANTDAITNAINNIGVGTPASTPDTAVLAYVAGIDTNTAHLNAAENPAPPPPPPPTP